MFLKYFTAYAELISSLTRKGGWPVRNWKIRNNGSKEKNQLKEGITVIEWPAVTRSQPY